MNEQTDRSLYKRIERLENMVQDLQQVLKQTNEPLALKTPDVSGDINEVPSSHSAPNPSPKPRKQPLPIKTPSTPLGWKSEDWLNKVGIGLLLFGVAFVFRYAVDQGWITPVARVSFGLGLGTALLTIGLRIYNKRRHFSQVILGGAIAIFYISGFAAFQLFNLVSHPVAMAFMISVTLLAFFLSLRQNQAVLSLIGALGGLGTPFLLYTGISNLPGLVGYTCLLLSGTSAIYFYKGWRSLLWTSVIGGWIVFLIGLSTGFSSDPQEAIGDRWALQWGVIFAWIAFGALPVIREIISDHNPTRWSRSPFDFGDKLLSRATRTSLNQHVHLLSVSTPLITLSMSMSTWSLPNETWGWIVMGTSIIYGFAAWKLKNWDTVTNLAYTHILIGILLFTLALCLLLSGDVLFFALAIQSTALHLIAHRLSNKGIAIVSHISFGALGLWLGIRLFLMPSEDTAILNAQALTDLSFIIAALGVSKFLTSSTERFTYRHACHMAVLGWLARELSTLPNGQGCVTIAWGIYAITLLILALRLNLDTVRTVAMGILLLVVGKLFFIDLAQVEAIWRILLFLGFGGLFLLISYYFSALTKPEPDSATLPS